MFDKFLKFYDQEQTNFTNRIELLKAKERQERAALEAEADEQKKNWIYMLFSIITLLLSLVIIGIARSNKKNKKTNAELSDLIEQKNILFKEVHHRVKNNFQIISSLLNLQRGTVRDNEGINALKEAQARIQAMSLVHEMLYERNNIKAIDFKQYAEQLTASILNSLIRNVKIDYELIGEGYTLDLDKAIPLGLILNEAITNTAKHAFKGIDAPKITIVFSANGEGEFGISIKDNGVGLPTQMIIDEKETLGLELIHILTEQINGKLNIVNDKGTLISIWFKC